MSKLQSQDPIPLPATFLKWMQQIEKMQNIGVIEILVIILSLLISITPFIAIFMNSGIRSYLAKNEFFQWPLAFLFSYLAFWLIGAAFWPLKKKSAK